VTARAERGVGVGEGDRAYSGALKGGGGPLVGCEMNSAPRMALSRARKFTRAIDLSWV
jgi:hypothetical protein